MTLRKAVLTELRKLVADQLAWWAWRLDPERFEKAHPDQRSGGC